MALPLSVTCSQEVPLDKLAEHLAHAGIPIATTSHRDITCVFLDGYGVAHVARGPRLDAGQAFVVLCQPCDLQLGYAIAQGLLQLGGGGRVALPQKGEVPAEEIARGALHGPLVVNEEGVRSALQSMKSGDHRWHRPLSDFFRRRSPRPTEEPLLKEFLELGMARSKAEPFPAAFEKQRRDLVAGAEKVVEALEALGWEKEGGAKAEGRQLFVVGTQTLAKAENLYDALQGLYAVLTPGGQSWAQHIGRTELDGLWQAEVATQAVELLEALQNAGYPTEI
jgi:hypothetical protein